MGNNSNRRGGQEQLISVNDQTTLRGRFEHGQILATGFDPDPAFPLCESMIVNS